MPDIDLPRLRSVAVDVATEAAELVERIRAAAVTDVDTKTSETDVVTAADRASERLIRSRLAALRPGEPVVGEEETTDTSGLATLLDGELCWVVDPIDGTVNYLYGLPWYTVSVAAAIGGQPVAAAVVEPSSGRVWSAARGLGATLDGRPLRTSGARRLELSLIGTGFSYLPQRRAWQGRLAVELINNARDVRRCGSSSLDQCAVAAGWLDGYVEHGLAPWDWAGGSLIAEEAGAVVRVPTLDGSDPDGLGADVTVAAAPGIADSLRDLVRAAMASGVETR